MIFGSCELSGRTGHEAGRALLSELYPGEELPPIAIGERGKPYFVDSCWHCSI